MVRAAVQACGPLAIFSCKSAVGGVAFEKSTSVYPRRCLASTLSYASRDSFKLFLGTATPFPALEARTYVLYICMSVRFLDFVDTWSAAFEENNRFQ